MKYLKSITSAILCLGVLALSAATIDKMYLWRGGKYVGMRLQEILWNSDSLVSIGDSTFNLNEVDSLTFSLPASEYVQADTVYVVYNDDRVSISPAQVQGVSVNSSGAEVSLTNTNTDREMTFVLRGSSTAGSFTYNGSYKTTVRLAGVNLQSAQGAALNILCGKRVALELADETTNHLEDAVSDRGQKATLYCKGHMEVSGAGVLTVKGNVKHAISTKEYLLIKKTAGDINIAGAGNDGIHAGQYFQMNGGSLTVNGVSGDAIQAEANGDGEEDDGQLIIKDGTLNLTLTGNDAAALKSDSLLTISGGSLNITTSGAADKGLKSKADVYISGGEIAITQTGNYMVFNGDPSYCTAIKANGNLTMTGGSLTIDNTAEAGKGLSADGDIYISEETSAVTLDIKANGVGAALDMSRNIEEEDDTDAPGEDEDDKPSYCLYVALSNTTSNYWKNIYLYSVDGTKVAQLTKTATIQPTTGTTRTFYVYDFEGPANGSYYFASDNYSSNSGGGGGRPGGGGGATTTFAIRSTTFTGPSTGADMYKLLSANSYSTSGTTRTFSLTDVTSTYSSGTVTATGSANSSTAMATAAGIKGDKNITIDGGTITLANTGKAAKSMTCEQMLTINGGTFNITNSGAGLGSGTSCSTAKGMTSDGTVALNGGDITITMTGSGGKCVKSEGTLTIGTADGKGPTLQATTTGSTYSSTSSAKAIKALGAVTVYGGELTVKTSTSGAEGLESKTSVDIRGGKHYFNCYDDGINSSGCIYFNGGITVCYSYGNDAVDSNAGKAGAITIGDGTVLAYTTKGSPEEGLDCDNNSYIQITGTGTAISAGGVQGGGGGWGGTSSSSSIGSATQGYGLITSTISYASNRYYTLADSDGNNMITYNIPATLNSSLSLITASGMVKGKSYSLKYSTTKPTDATVEFQGVYLGSTAKGTTSSTTFTAK